jgi:membrane associated rhomboid family serine protease
MANVGYMIFTLVKKGYRHYSGYISQLFFLLCLMILLVAKDVAGGIAISISLTGIFLVVILPMFLQKQIDMLMAENRLDEIEPLARWKANLAWSELNVHLHRIARIAGEMSTDPERFESEIRQLLNRGEPYDSMTRVFIGLIHFNNRNFEGLIRDLVVEKKDINDYTFEELLYLIRAYLETTRFPEAIEAQLALERKLSDPEDFSAEKVANLVISRMIFFAFLGWRKDFDLLLQAGEDGIERLPEQIRDFWKGVCYFNSGEFELGEQIMGAAMRSCNEQEGAEAWLPFMRKRFFGLIENREFIGNRLLPELKKLEEEHSPILNEIISQQIEEIDEKPESEVCTNILAWLTMMVSIALMFSVGVEDLVSLIRIGANSSFLVQEGEYYRLFTCLFIHIGWIHLMMNTLALKYFGPPVETVVGWPLFLGIYFFSGLIGGLAAVYAGQPLSAGASGAVLGLLSAAIVFELMKVRGSERLARKNNFSTLVFILVINLIIGFVEQGVDNSAHLGGLFGGAALSFILIPVLSKRFLKTAASALAIFFVAIYAGFSLFQILTDSQTYPERIKQFHKLTNASQSMELELPTSWKLEKSGTDFRELAVIGPFRERLTALVSFNELSDEEVLKEHVSQRTRELETTPELMLKVRKGPDLIASDSRRVYQLKWQIVSTNGPISVVDYLVFDNQLLFLVRFFIATAETDAYDNIFNHAIKTFESPFFEP